MILFAACVMLLPGLFDTANRRCMFVCRMYVSWLSGVRKSVICKDKCELMLVLLLIIRW